MDVPAGIVHDLHVRHAAHAPPGKLHSQAQIGVFAVHEEALVEPAQRSKRLGIEQQAHARQPVEIRIGSVRLRFQPAFQNPKRGRKASGRVGRAAVGIQDRRRNQPIAALPRRKQGPQRIAAEAQIRVQNREPVRIAALERAIVVGPESERTFVAYDKDFEWGTVGAHRRDLRNVKGHHHAPQRRAGVVREVRDQRIDQPRLAVADDRCGHNGVIPRARAVRAAGLNFRCHSPS